mgnify:CR=1 FL=1
MFLLPKLSLFISFLHIRLVKEESYRQKLSVALVMILVTAFICFVVLSLEKLVVAVLILGALSLAHFDHP